MNESRTAAGRGPGRDLAKERIWRQHVARQRRSKLTIRDYCAQAGISEPSFYAWRAELARRDSPTKTAANRTPTNQTATNTSKTSRCTATSRPRFLPVTIGPSIASHVELACASGLVIRIPASETAALRSVLEHLEPRPC